MIIIIIIMMMMMMMMMMISYISYISYVSISLIGAIPCYVGIIDVTLKRIKSKYLWNNFLESRNFSL